MTRLPGDWVAVDGFFATLGPAHESTLARGLPVSPSCPSSGVDTTAKVVHPARGGLTVYRFRAVRQLTRGRQKRATPSIT